jgi:hypothetical protein
MLATPVVASPAIQPEIGVSYFFLRHTALERGSYRLSIDEPEKFAPFVAANAELNDWLGLRFSYTFVNNARTTAMLGSPPGSPLTVVVWGHYDDDIHVVSAAPEFKWRFTPALSLGVAPQVNWVASRGTISYSTDNPTVLLVGPRDRHDDGFTLGGSARLLWSLSARATLTLGYQYLDLDPSFDREAHVISGGLQWKF